MAAKQKKSVSGRKFASKSASTTAKPIGRNGPAKGTTNRDMRRTKSELVEELSVLRKQVARLKKSSKRQKQSRGARSYSKEQLLAFMDAIPDVVYIYDLEGRSIFVNEGFAKFAGKSKEELIGKNVDELVPIDLAEYCKASNEKVIKSGITCTVEEPVGDLIYETVKAPIFDAKKNTIGLMGISRDVTDTKHKESMLKKSKEELESMVRERTAMLMSINEDLESEIAERKKIEKKLLHNQNYLKSIIEAESDCVMIIDPDYRIIEMNNAGIQMIGENSHEKVLGTTLCPVVDTEYNEAFYAFIRAVCDGEERAITYTITDRSGKRKWLESHGVPFSDGINNRTLMLAVTRDITQRKEAEERIRESEEKYRMIFDNSPLGIFHFDKNGIITDCNDQFAGINGATEDKIVGFDLINQLQDDKIKDTIAAVLSGDFGQFEGEYLSVAGNKRTTVNVVISPVFSEDGALLGGIGIVEDISERKETEDALKASKEFTETMIELTPT